MVHPFSTGSPHLLPFLALLSAPCEAQLLKHKSPHCHMRLFGATVFLFLFLSREYPVAIKYNMAIIIRFQSFYGDGNHISLYHQVNNLSFSCFLLPNVYTKYWLYHGCVPIPNPHSEPDAQQHFNQPTHTKCCFH